MNLDRLTDGVIDYIANTIDVLSDDDRADFLTILKDKLDQI